MPEAMSHYHPQPGTITADLPRLSASVKEVVARYGFQIIGRTEECRQPFHAISAERKLTNPAVLVITSRARLAFSE